MNWFWRAAIAIGVGIGSANSQFYAALRLESVAGASLWTMDHVAGGLSTSWRYALATTLVYMTPGLVLAVLTYAMLNAWFRGRGDAETRCRKCGYILRGISEPRCPECGERI